MSNANIHQETGRRLLHCRAGVPPAIEQFTPAGGTLALHFKKVTNPVLFGHTPTSGASRAFTLLELLVAMAVFSLMIVMMLSMTNSLIGHSARIDENTEIERDVRVFFDLLRRDLAQARIGQQQNIFRGESNRLFFAASSPLLKTNHVSDVRLIVYQFTGGNVSRSVVEPTIANFTNGVWNSSSTNWWQNAGLTNASFTEVILEGVQPYSNYPFFAYVARTSGNPLSAPTQTTNPPAGVEVSFGILGKNDKAKGGAVTNATKEFKYDIELSLPPIFDP